MALTHGAHSPTWRLADTCHQCCAAMPSTATVPEPDARTAPEPCPPSADKQGPARTGISARPILYEESVDGQVWEASDVNW